jgi:hypothetical protein
MANSNMKDLRIGHAPQKKKKKKLARGACLFQQ